MQGSKRSNRSERAVFKGPGISTNSPGGLNWSEFIQAGLTVKGKVIFIIIKRDRIQELQFLCLETERTPMGILGCGFSFALESILTFDSIDELW